MTKKIVLLADDSPTVGTAIGNLLRDENDIQFNYCRDPVQVVDRVRALQPTVLLLDLVMPEVDGLTVLKELRDDPQFSALPVIILSSKESAEVKAECFATGATDYMVKIPDGLELVARIEHHTRVYLQHDKTNQVLRQKQRDLVEQNLRLEELTRELKVAHEEALQASRTKSAFLANMSHEIRTPMNAIIGLTNLCLEDELTPTQREFLSNVSESANSLLGIINDILDLSKIEAGLLDFDPQPVCLRDLLDLVGKTVAYKAHSKNVEIIFDLSQDVPEQILTDALRLRQVVLNLISNAVKFTNDGEISVAVEVTCVQDDEITLKFAVHDTGIGIPSHRLDSIFEAFTQADNSTTRNYGGTGLGLTIAASLVELMGGEISVESEVGKGSTFFFTMKTLEVNEPLPDIPSEFDPELLRGLRILVVDDNHTNLRILEAMLESVGVRCETASNAEDALEILTQLQSLGERLDLVITDAHMPEIDGFALAQRIKENPVFTGQQIMMLSSADLRGDLARCRELGIGAHLTKPVSRSDLLNSIASQLPKSTLSRQPQSNLSPISAKAPTRSAKILLAEDNPVNQMVASAYLEKIGAELTIVDNGVQAFEAAIEQEFDVILMDVQMPVMDGVESTVKIRERGIKTPIIALTAHALKGDAENFLTNGMDAYVSKPIDEKQLLETIEHWVQKSPTHQQGVTPTPSGVVRVLVIDDSVNYRNAIKNALKAPGIEVVGSASDGRKGLDAVESLRPDVITLDFEMPDMDGLETLRELRAREFNTGVVLVSSLATRVTREALDLGVDRIVLKPKSGLSHSESVEYLREQLVGRVLELGRLKQFREKPRTEGPFKVLVLDDSRFQRRQVCRYFRSRGIDPVEATSVAEAVEQLEAMDGADLLMVDLFLPGQDGLSMIRELRKRPEHMNGRIVIMSSENRQDEIIRCVEAGADEYLMKPFDEDTLFAKLSHVFGSDHPAFGEPTHGEISE